MDKKIVHVKIEWDTPLDSHWLNPDNIAIALHAYCKNTKFKVTDCSCLAEENKKLVNFVDFCREQKEAMGLEAAHEKENKRRMLKQLDEIGEAVEELRSENRRGVSGMRTDKQALEFLAGNLCGTSGNKCPHTEGCYYLECDNSKGSANAHLQGKRIDFKYCTGTPKECWIRYAKGEE